MAIDTEVEPVLVAFVKNNRLQFSTNTFKEIVAKVGSRPVSFVSINYPNEEQRNEIFNECLKYLENFRITNDGNKRYVWKSKSNTDTKGIYLCPEPIIVKKSAQEVALFLMETNASIDEQTATRDDMMVFALSSVLSSTLIYSIENRVSNDFLDFIQLFHRYAKGGIGADFSESLQSLVLLIRNWKNANRYPYGFHDISTCPMSTDYVHGDRMFNYRKDRLRIDTETAFANSLNNSINKYFVDSYQKISFCLIPGEEIIDRNSNIPKFGDILHQIIGRLFHPSSISIKALSHQKLNGQNLVTLFEQLSALMTECMDNPKDSKEEFKTEVRNMAVLLSGINYYKFEMDKIIEDINFTDKDLSRAHIELRDNALKTFETVKGVSEQNAPKIYELFRREAENVWHFYQDLNRFKLETLNDKRIIQTKFDQMIERIAQMRTEFNGKHNTLDSEISQLIGFSLDGLTKTVRSIIGNN